MSDSRYAVLGGTATEFEIAIPQGGLELPDNAVGFADAISVLSFTNVFSCRHRVYIRKKSDGSLHIRTVTLTLRRSKRRG